jgi:hypothetical protein
MNAADMVRQPERRLFSSGSDAQDLGGILDDAEIAKTTDRLCDLPVLPILVTRREFRAPEGD